MSWPLKASLGLGANRLPVGFDLARCSDNLHNDWIGGEIRAGAYGWVTTGDLELAAKRIRADEELSHRGDEVHGAVLLATWGAAIPGRRVFLRRWVGLRRLRRSIQERLKRLCWFGGWPRWKRTARRFKRGTRRFRRCIF